MEPLTIGLLAGGAAAVGGGLGGIMGNQRPYSEVSTFTPEQKWLMGLLSKYFGRGIGKPLESYGGQRVAGMSPAEQQGQNLLGQYLGGYGQYMPQRQAAYGRALGGAAMPVNRQELAPIDMSASKNWFNQQVVPQYQQRFQQFAAPALEQARSMGARTSSSAMNRALAEQSGNMAQRLGDIGYQYMLTEQQAQRERELANVQMGRERELQNLQYQQAAMGMVEPERLERLGQIGVAQQYGSLPRLLEQADLEAKFQEWMRTRPEYSPFLQYALQLLGISGMGFMPSGGGVAGGAATGAGSMLGGLGSILGGTK